MERKSRFTRFAKRTAQLSGRPVAFCLALATIVAWLLSGPIFGFSDTWQLVINTGTTIVTFLMVFLIQNTQNRDAKAMHLKLDELIRATRSARNSLVDLEDCSDEELELLHQAFARLRERQPAIQIQIDEIAGEREQRAGRRQSA